MSPYLYLIYNNSQAMTMERERNMGTLFSNVKFDVWNIFPDEIAHSRKRFSQVSFRKWDGHKWIYEVLWAENEISKNVGFVTIRDLELIKNETDTTCYFEISVSSGYNLRPDGLTLGEIGRRFEKDMGL